MGDEGGIRLRCICLGDAALRGSRMSAMGRCGKGSASRIVRSSLSIAGSSVCAASRCLRINITVHQKVQNAGARLNWCDVELSVEVSATRGEAIRTLTRARAGPRRAVRCSTLLQDVAELLLHATPVSTHLRPTILMRSACAMRGSTASGAHERLQPSVAASVLKLLAELVCDSTASARNLTNLLRQRTPAKQQP